MDNYKITFETWNKLAQIYQDKFMKMDLYNDTYDLFCSEIKKQCAKILEIGCGPGNITRYILAKRPDFEIEAIDTSPNMIKVAKENNPSANFSVMDCRNIDELPPQYDAVMCGFCMPYLSEEDCTKLIKDSYSLLSKNGIIYFSTIEGEYIKSDFETSSDGHYKMYVYLHEENFLMEALKKNNFELLHLIRKNYEKSDGTISTHMIFIAKKI